MSHPERRLAALTTAAAVLALTACGGATPNPSTPPASAAARPPTASPSTPPAVPTSPGAARGDDPAPPPEPVELEVQSVATKYLAARENAVSYRHPSPRSWLSDVRPLMTPSGWTYLTRTLGAAGGYSTAVARARRWSVQVTVACTTNPDAGPATRTDATITCALTDRTVDAGGIPVPTKKLPSLWPYDGSQPPALLRVNLTEHHWLVDHDLTGQAS